MQDAIDEARNHVAVVRSSEFASVKSHFDELLQRQDAALAKLSPAVVYAKLKDEVDKVWRGEVCVGGVHSRGGRRSRLARSSWGGSTLLYAHPPSPPRNFAGACCL